jgi:tetratricopeptide (TPR) repeat protein
MWGKDEIRNEITDGVFYSAVIQGRDIALELPREITSAMTGLPAASPAFTGRGKDLAALLEILAPPPSASHTASTSNSPPTAAAVTAVTVSGMGGVGKTELAIQAAHAALDRGWFPGGVLFVDLHGDDPDRRVEPGQALDGFLRAMRIPGEHIPPAEQDRERLYASVLREGYARQGRRVLVVVDGASSHEQARPLLPSDNVNASIVTSRHTLGLLRASRLDLGILPPKAAVGMLRRALQTGRPGDTRITNHADDAAMIAQLCGRLPLALEIIAALLADDPERPLGALAEDLRNERTRLDELSYEDRSVRAAFSLSYRRLEPAEARLLRLLSVNPGPDISTEAAVILSGADQATLLARFQALSSALEKYDTPGTTDWPRTYPLLRSLTSTDHAHTRRTMEALARVHLVERGTAYGRWRMHDLVRLFASERAREKAGQDNRAAVLYLLLIYYFAGTEAASLHLDHNIQAPDPATMGFADEKQALQWLDSEYSNLTATVYVAAKGRKDLRWIASALPLALGHLMRLRGRLDDDLALSTIALRVARQSHDRRSEGTILRNRGATLAYMRRFDEAINPLQEAIKIFRATANRHGEGSALSTLGVALQEAGRSREAITALRESVQIHREIGARYSEGKALDLLGLTLLRAGQSEEAVTPAQEAVKIFRQIKDQRAQAVALNNLGAALRKTQRSEEAITLYKRSAKLHQLTHNPRGEIRVLVNLGGSLADVQRFDEAIATLQEAIQMSRDLRDRAGEAAALNNLALALKGAGRIDEANTARKDAAAIGRDLNAEVTETGLYIALEGSASTQPPNKQRTLCD